MRTGKKFVAVAGVVAALGIVGLSPAAWALPTVYNAVSPTTPTNWDALTWNPVGVPGSDPLDVANLGAVYNISLLLNGNRSVGAVGGNFSTINQTNLSDTLTLNSSGSGSGLNVPALSQGNGHFTLNVPIILGNNIFVSVGGGNGPINLTGTLTDSGNNYSISTVSSNGYAWFKNASVSFGGGANINSGFLAWQPNSGSGPVAVSAFGGAGGMTLNGGSFELNLTGSNVATASYTSGNVRVLANGGGFGVQGNGTVATAVTVNSLNVDLGGTLVLGTYGTTRAGSTATFNGTVSLNRTTSALRAIEFIQGSGTGAPASFGSSTITDGGAGSFTTPLILKAWDTAAFALAAANSYTGATIIDSTSTGGAGIVSVGAASSLGSGSVTIRNGGRLRLGAASNVSAPLTLAGTAIQPAMLALAYDGVVPALTPAAAAQSDILGIDTAAYSQTLDMAAIAGGRLFLGATAAGTYNAATLGVGSGNVYRLGGGGGTLTLANAVLADNGGANALVVGSNAANAYGTVKSSVAQPMTGSVTVNPGSKLEGVAQASGSPFGTGNVTLNNGTLQLDVNANNNSSTNGALTVSGQSYVTVSGTTTGKITTVNLSDTARANRGLLMLSGSNLGSGGANDARVKLTVAPSTTAVNIGQHGGTDTMVAPYITRDSADFVTYDPTYGFKPVAYSANGLEGVNDANKEVVATSTVTLTGPHTVYALKVNGGTLTGSAATPITITSGGLITGANANIRTPINFGSAEGIIYGASVFNNALWFDDANAKITGTGGLTISTFNNGWVAMTSADNSATLFGTITINRGGLVINIDKNLGDASNAIVLNGGALTHTSPSNTWTPARAFSTGPAGGTIVNGTNAGNVDFSSSTITLDGPLTISSGANMTTTFGGLVQNAAGKSGALILSGQNITFAAPAANLTYTGGTVIRSATVNVNAGSSMGNGDVMMETGTLNINENNALTGRRLYTSLNANGGSFYGSGGANQWNYPYNNFVNFLTAAPLVGSLEGLGNVVLGNSTGAVNTILSVGGDNTSSAFYGAISQVAGRTTGLTKTGSGTFILGGPNSYTGATSVNAGTLLVNGSLNAASAVTVNNAGTILGGTGVIGGAVTVTGGTFMAPGASAGKLTVGSYTQQPGATLLIELAGLTQGVSYDWLNVTGTANLAGTLSVDAIGPWFLDYGQTFTVLTAGTLGTNSIVLGGPDAAWFTMNTVGNSFVLTSQIPEPAAVALLAAGGLALLRRRPRA